MACKACFCAARDNCQAPSVAVTAIATSAASVSSQKRQPKRACAGLIMGSMKILVALAFLAIIASLGSALFFMMRGNGNDRQRGKHMARALALRVGLSIVLFLCLLLAWKLGYIQPTGLPAVMR